MAAPTPTATLPPRPPALSRGASLDPAPGPLLGAHRAVAASLAHGMSAPLTPGGTPQPGTRDSMRRSPSSGWEALGLPSGPGAPLFDPTITPANNKNKYAQSWFGADAQSAAGARQVLAAASSLQQQASQHYLGYREPPHQQQRQQLQPAGLVASPSRRSSAGSGGRPGSDGEGYYLQSGGSYGHHQQQQPPCPGISPHVVTAVDLARQASELRQQRRRSSNSGSPAVSSGNGGWGGGGAGQVEGEWAGAAVAGVSSEGSSLPQYGGFSNQQPSARGAEAWMMQQQETAEGRAAARAKWQVPPTHPHHQ
jgi:hypothetical protein